MCRGVRDLDPKVIVQPDDDDADDVVELRKVSKPLLEGKLGGLGAASQPTEAVGEPIFRSIGDARRIRHRRVGLAKRGGDRGDRLAARPGDPDSDRKRDRLDRDERDHDAVHGASIAYGGANAGITLPS